MARGVKAKVEVGAFYTVQWVGESRESRMSRISYFPIQWLLISIHNAKLFHVS